MTYSLEFEIPGLPPMNSANAWHWRKRHGYRTKWKRWVVDATRGRAPSEPLEKAKVTITRCSSSEPDFDNLVQGGKFVLDGLQIAGVIKDDKSSVIGQPVYHWEKAKPKHGLVRVVVEGVE